MMPRENREELWTVAAREVLECLKELEDMFTPSLEQLVRFSFNDDEEAMRVFVQDFFKRCDIMWKILRNSSSLPDSQRHNLWSNLHNIAHRGNLIAVGLYRRKAEQVHRTMTELLNVEAKTSGKLRKKRATSSTNDNMECVICQDDIAHFTYTPCKHKVACLSCAESFWQKASTCPWCRSEIEKPE